MPSATEGADRRRTQAERRATTQAALLAAAGDVIVERGVGAVTLALVGSRAGYSRGIVTHHYGSKQALLDAVARHAQSEIATALGDEPPGRERLLRLIDGYLLAMSDGRPRWSVFVLLWVEAISNRDLAVIMRERDRYFRAEVLRDVAAGVATGTMDPDVEPEAVAVAVVGQLRGISLQLLLDPTAVDLEHMREHVSQHWRRALGAPRPPSDGSGAER